MSEPKIDHARLANQLLPAIIAAGHLLETYRKAGVRIEKKADGSPVSRADREAEGLLLAALTEALPAIPAIGEEAVAAGTAPAPGKTCVFIDALDGTREFVKGGEDYTVNIGVVSHGQPDFGIIYAPALALFFATREPGHVIEAHLPHDSTARQLADLSPSPIVTKKVNPNGIRLLASRTTRQEDLDRLLAGTTITDTQRTSSSIKFCNLARGDADIYPRFGPTNFWDTVAGHAILSASGGVVVTPDLTPFTYDTRQGTDYKNTHFIAVGDPDILSFLK